MPSQTPSGARGSGTARWRQSPAAIAAVRIERVTVRNPLDSHWPNYTTDGASAGSGGAPSPAPSAGCRQLFTAFFTLGTGKLGSNPCVRQYTNASAQQQPLTMLFEAAAAHNISVVLGLAWSGSAPANATGLATLATLQNSVADRLWELYAGVQTRPPASTVAPTPTPTPIHPTPTPVPSTTKLAIPAPFANPFAGLQAADPTVTAGSGAGPAPAPAQRRPILVGAYTEVEMSNCHPTVFGQAYVDQYLVPVTRHIAQLQRAAGLPTAFIYGDPYYSPKSSCLSAEQYGTFWQNALEAAPGMTLIAPQDGVGAHNLSAATVRAFLGALRNGSHAAGRRFGVLIELFEQHPVGSYHQPDCDHRRPATWSRIKQQLATEAAVGDRGELTAWEFHAYLSPLPGPCFWARGAAAAQRNASDGLYQQYRRHVQALFPPTQA